MEDPGPEGAQEPKGPVEERLPEFMNPESEHYQPWADKQIFNASKDKRPLAEFLAEFEERLQAAGPVTEPAWEPNRNHRLLARFDPRSAEPRRKSRRRRRPAGHPPSPAVAATSGSPKAPRPRPSRPAPAVPGAPAAPGHGPRRRRRRRRPGGGGSAPQGG